MSPRINQAQCLSRGSLRHFRYFQEKDKIIFDLLIKEGSLALKDQIKPKKIIMKCHRQKENYHSGKE